MSNKTNVLALRPFSHGNVDAQEGKVYALNAGDAHELEKAGFVSFEGATGKVADTQIDQVGQVAQPGDVVVDEAEDILGAKMDTALQNKARNAKK